MVAELEQLVLLALLRLGPLAYGVAIAEEIEARAGRPTSLGSVYKTLIRLETKRLVVTRMGEPTPERGGRRKRYYQLTPAGQAALQASLEAIRRMTSGLREVRLGEQR